MPREYIEDDDEWLASLPDTDPPTYHCACCGGAFNSGLGGPGRICATCAEYEDFDSPADSRSEGL